VYLKHSVRQLQCSEPLQFQAKAGDRFADLAAWILANLHADLSVENLAARAGLSPRQFDRRFKSAFGANPAQYVEFLRLDEASNRLTAGPSNIDRVASAVGFFSDDAFRRAFHRRFGCAPTEYATDFQEPTMPRPGKFLAPLLLLLGAANAPLYTPSGDLIAPTHYRDWVFLSSGLDMSYSDSPAMQGMSMFNNVFVDPDSWQEFKETGHWPDGTMFVLEVRGAESRRSINKHGKYQTQQVMGTEIHVRDEARFKGGWGFFDMDGNKVAKFIAYKESRYACHQAHGAVDTSFTQFYPTAKPIAMKAGTYRDKQN
jgi:AraC-like DNA-binding protein